MQHKHGPLHLQAFVGEIAAMVVVKQHHQRPGPGHEMAPSQRGQAARPERLHRLCRGVDAAKPHALAGLAAALLQRLHGTQGDEVAARPNQPGVGIPVKQPVTLFGRFFAAPAGVDQLVQHHIVGLGHGPLQALVAPNRAAGGAVATDGQQVQLAVCSLGARRPPGTDQSLGREVTGIFGPGLQRA